MNNIIQKGDKVNVFMNKASELFNCEVLHIPSAIGDSWHLRTEQGTLYYVQLFECMQLIK